MHLLRSFLKLLSGLWVFCLHVRISVYRLHFWHLMESEENTGSPWNWSCRGLWATIWILDIELSLQNSQPVFLTTEPCFHSPPLRCQHSQYRMLCGRVSQGLHHVLLEERRSKHKPVQVQRTMEAVWEGQMMPPGLPRTDLTSLNRHIHPITASGQLRLLVLLCETSSQ